MTAFHELIGQDASTITWWQMTVRAILIFLYGLLLIRVAGRRAFGRYTTLDIVLAVIIGSNLSRALTANARFLPTLAASAGIVLAYWASIHLVALSDTLGWLVKGDTVRLVEDGRIDARAMRRVAVSRGDLEEAMREQGVRRLDRVALATLERNGKISVIRK